MKHKIVIVEDNPGNSFITEMILTNNGYRSIVFRNGKEILEWSKDNTADLVLMDINLPDTNGFEITKKLKAMDTFKSVPFAALTAHPIRLGIDDALSVGMSDYLPKPISEDHLLNTIRKLLGKYNYSFKS